jgi:hypothetical protein
MFAPEGFVQASALLSLRVGRSFGRSSIDESRISPATFSARSPSEIDEIHAARQIPFGRNSATSLMRCTRFTLRNPRYQGVCAINSHRQLGRSRRVSGVGSKSAWHRLATSTHWCFGQSFVRNRRRSGIVASPCLACSLATL